MKFHEDPSSGNRVIPCEWTDGRTHEAIVALCEFASASKNKRPLPSVSYSLPRAGVRIIPCCYLIFRVMAAASYSNSSGRSVMQPTFSIINFNIIHQSRVTNEYYSAGTRFDSRSRYWLSCILHGCLVHSKAVGSVK